MWAASSSCPLPFPHGSLAVGHPTASPRCGGLPLAARSLNRPALVGEFPISLVVTVMTDSVSGWKPDLDAE